MPIYDTVDPKYSTLVLKTLSEYLIRSPPYDDHKLLLIATTGKKCLLKDMESLSSQLKDQNLSIGIKKLIDVVQTTNKDSTDEHRCAMFMDELKKNSGQN